VFPVAVVDGNRVTQPRGTAFLIGLRGFALTAGHCVPRSFADFRGLFRLPDRWVAVHVQDVALHPREDVAIMRLSINGDIWGMLRLDATLHSPELECEVLGYPEETYYELQADEGTAPSTPQIVNTRTYVRRRVDNRNHGMQGGGGAFYELSPIAGDGCSGAPVIAYDAPGTKSYRVVGVYKGQRQMTSSAGITSAVGYATRSSDIGDWAPAMLGRPLAEEANPPPGVTPARSAP
jgi:hypothetical protein